MWRRAFVGGATRSLRPRRHLHPHIDGKGVKNRRWKASGFKVMADQLGRPGPGWRQQPRAQDAPALDRQRPYLRQTVRRLPARGRQARAMRLNCLAGPAGPGRAAACSSEMWEIRCWRHDLLADAIPEADARGKILARSWQDLAQGRFQRPIIRLKRPDRFAACAYWA
jgi:hypothetical protein